MKNIAGKDFSPGLFVSNISFYNYAVYAHQPECKYYN